MQDFTWKMILSYPVNISRIYYFRYNIKSNSQDRASARDKEQI